MRKIRNAYKILVRKPEGKTPLERHRYRLEYNIEVYLRKVRCEFLASAWPGLGMGWTGHGHASAWAGLAWPCQA
jgi:hypothetical protein